MRHLSLVPHLSRSPQPQPSDAPPAEPAEAQVAHVPMRLLLAASGRCSCDECCVQALRERHEAPRPANGTDRQPVRNLHLLS